jgi:hypothetical protein
MVVRAVDYQLIARQLYKMGLDSILRRCVLDHERQDILWECHKKVVGGHVGGKATAQKFLQDGLWWEYSLRMQRYMLDHVMFFKEWVIHHDEMNYHCNQFDLYKNLRNGTVDFIGPINPTTKH